ncbi:acyl-CoA thioesterase [Deinococcus sp. A31D244]|uniref:acyl-CoA thioesterase n=1 Tax=Deinococcus sp. A31D244 TaxID=3397675 RepID=UPI0039E04E81
MTVSTDAVPAGAASPTRIPALNWGDAHRTTIQLRYGDLDAMGHVNNARYAEFLEVARMDLSRALEVRDADDRSVLARLELDYVRDIRLGQEVVIETLIERVGRTSWTGVARILADGVPCAFARSVQVRVDDQGLPAVIPPGFAERIAPVLVRAATL